MHIRPAQVSDAEQLLAIYAYYVKNTAISFEYAVPSLEAFQNRIRTTLKQYLYLVLENENTVYGYAYAGTFVGRAAYAWSCETSIYLDHTVQKQGYGRKLYEALEKKTAGSGHLECIRLHCVP
ncbi:MAG: GNAT family N-acetyltransferase [Mailhella sp.]|nr:GNAT family N-acetyltransferase [Mailhella sp.]